MRVGKENEGEREQGEEKRGKEKMREDKRVTVIKMEMSLNLRHVGTLCQVRGQKSLEHHGKSCLKTDNRATEDSLAKQCESQSKRMPCQPCSVENQGGSITDRATDKRHL